MTRPPDLYPLPLPPTPTTPCRSCGAPVLGTRAGYLPHCPRCRDAGAAVPEDAPGPVYAYRSPRAAIASATRVLSRARGCPAVLPDRDRVMGGEGSRRAEDVAQAALVMAIVDAGVPSVEWADVVCAWAVGCTAPGGRYEQDSPFSWDWAARHVGERDRQRVHRRMGGITRALYAAIREAGLCEGREDKEGAETVTSTTQKPIEGWAAIGARLHVTPRVARGMALAAIHPLPVRYAGRTPRIWPHEVDEWERTAPTLSQIVSSGVHGH